MKQRADWFEIARFGMFIHWGLYAIPGGKWKGMETPWVSEWVMHRYRVPKAEYEKLAKKFNPIHFDAEKWVKAAADAGMKYMIFTAKHHDGFAMFHSKCDPYNIVDASPFKRDVVGELAEACKKYGLRLGLYYSQDQDWHEEGASGNTWDFPPTNKEKFEAYLERKVKPQLRELLTNYGKIAVIWFDTPNTITPEQSEDLAAFVHSLQKDCLVSGRIGNDKGDYNTLGDNQIPTQVFKVPTEGLGTMNESWGYKSFDRAYRTPEAMLLLLAKMAARNANYLLNVGPDKLGRFPAPALKRLEKIGAFINEHKEALYGTSAMNSLPFCNIHWGEVTRKGNIAYFWIFKPVKEIIWYGIDTPLLSAEVMGSSEKISFEEMGNEGSHYYRLRLHNIPKRKGPFIIKAVFEGDCGGVMNAWGAGSLPESAYKK